MLRLERIENPDGSILIRVHGRIGGAWVDELRECCERALETSRPLQLDLQNVTFIDRDGMALLRSLWSQLVILRSSLFAAELLKRLQTASDPDSRTSW